ncbi:hypothetical protein AX17_001809, partial [Amanita inopinata Kibby_2008]
MILGDAETVDGAGELGVWGGEEGAEGLVVFGCEEGVGNEVVSRCLEELGGGKGARLEGSVVVVEKVEDVVDYVLGEVWLHDIDVESMLRRLRCASYSVVALPEPSIPCAEHLRNPCHCVWYASRARRQKTLIRPLETAQNECLRWILGAFSTSPVDELHHISAILPIHIFLEKLSNNAALCLRHLPRLSQVLACTPSSWEEHNPDLYVNAPDPTNPTKPHTIIQHLAAKTSPKAERLMPYHTPPWERAHKWGSCRRDPFTSHQWSGAGFTTLLHGQNIKQGKWGLGRRAGIYDAELLAMAGGMGTTAELAHSNPQISRILIVADNQSTIKSLPDKTDHPGQLFSILFRKHADALLTDHPDTHIELTWAPGHRGIPGKPYHM